MWMGAWPFMTSNNNGLGFLRNNWFHRFSNVSWHSDRHFPWKGSIRHRVLRAVCDADLEGLETCLKEGWPIDEVVDKQGKYNALTLACHLDHLEVIHLLDVYGANINARAGKFQNTPLMAATARWNVRVVDYLIERGADPFIQDSFGFTATQKAEIKNLRTITSMLKQYESEIN
jgi:ankyrin repeat protein